MALTRFCHRPLGISKENSVGSIWYDHLISVICVQRFHYYLCQLNEWMAVLCGMNTIQYSARRLSVHKLFTSCIRRCLMSRACNWVMSVLSAMLLIYSFQFRPAFLLCRSARRHSGVVGLPNIGHRTVPKMSVGRFLVWSV